MVDLGGLLVDPDTPLKPVKYHEPSRYVDPHPSMSATIGVCAREPLNLVRCPQSIAQVAMSVPLYGKDVDLVDDEKVNQKLNGFLKCVHYDLGKNTSSLNRF